jgi:hypothetical protein
MESPERPTECKLPDRCPVCEWDMVRDSTAMTVTCTNHDCCGFRCHYIPWKGPIPDRIIYGEPVPVLSLPLDYTLEDALRARGISPETDDGAG